jgi:hypothetical protein
MTTTSKNGSSSSSKVTTTSNLPFSLIQTLRLYSALRPVIIEDKDLQKPTERSDKS